MRRGRRNSGEDDADVDMTPMLDIVFIMLIFFIVTANFLDESGVDLTQPPPPPDSDDNNKSTPAITVYVNERDRCSVDGEVTTCDRVALAVEGLLATKANASIILRVNEKARHNTLITLKDELDSRSYKSKLEIVKTE